MQSHVGLVSQIGTLGLGTWTRPWNSQHYSPSRQRFSHELYSHTFRQRTSYSTKLESLASLLRFLTALPPRHHGESQSQIPRSAQMAIFLLSEHANKHSLTELGRFIPLYCAQESLFSPLRRQKNAVFNTSSRTFAVRVFSFLSAWSWPMSIVKVNFDKYGGENDVFMCVKNVIMKVLYAVFGATVFDFFVDRILSSWFSSSHL